MIDFAIKDSHWPSWQPTTTQTLRELRDILRDVHPGCIYHHFWGTLLRPQFVDREYNNDFHVVLSQLDDSTAAERLAVIDPATRFGGTCRELVRLSMRVRRDRDDAVAEPISSSTSPAQSSWCSTPTGVFRGNF